MKPKLACADFTFPLLPHAKALDLIAMLGIKGVDIGLFEDRSHLWPSREFKRLRPSARQLKKKLGDRGQLPPTSSCSWEKISRSAPSIIHRRDGGAARATGLARRWSTPPNAARNT